MSRNARPGPSRGPGRNQHTATHADSVAHGIPWRGYEWRIRYQRADWAYAKSTFYQSLPAARRFIRRLSTPRPGDGLAPLVLLQLERRLVAPWVPTEVFIDASEPFDDPDEEVAW